jgi:DNA-binding NarL/FixJ family response regulator
VARGETWIDASSLNFLMEMNTSEGEQAGSPKLNDREQAVLKGVFEGLTNKEISTRLEISESYVKAVLQQLFAKTGVRTRSKLVRVHWNDASSELAKTSR